MTFDGAYVVIAFGAVGGDADGGEACARFIHELDKVAGPRVSYVYGRRRARVGVAGTDERKAFTFIFEGFRDCLRQLVELPLGSGRRV